LRGLIKHLKSHWVVKRKKQLRHLTYAHASCKQEKENSSASPGVEDKEWSPGGA
jgi:hypothetical protein